MTSKSKYNTQKENEGKPVKVDKWDGSALKNALDDCAKLILKNHLGFVESHTLMDGRLFLCTLSVLFSFFGLIWDWFNPFPKSREVLIICVLGYFFLMIVMTIYTMYVEKGCFMVAQEKDKAGIDPDNVWKLTSRLKRFDDEYELQLTFKDGVTGQERSGSFEKSVCNFFDENGYICEDLYEKEVLKLQSSLAMEKKEK